MVHLKVITNGDDHKYELGNGYSQNQWCLHAHQFNTPYVDDEMQQIVTTISRWET